MLLRDERSSQTHCLGGRRSVSVVGSARGGNSDVAAADNVLRRTAPKKQTFNSIDRLIFVCLYRLGVRDALAIVKPDTIVRWHRAGFRLYWCRESTRRGGRP